MEKIQISEMLSLYRDPEGVYHIVADIIQETADTFRSPLYPVDSGGVGIKVSSKTAKGLLEALRSMERIV